MNDKEQAVIDAAKLNDFMDSIYEALDHVAVANYASREAEARQMIQKAYDKLQKPETDWSNVPFGASVMHDGELWRFMDYDYHHKSANIWQARIGSRYFSVDECTLIPPTYTNAEWHEWTGERPDWVRNNDVICFQTSGGRYYTRPGNYRVEPRLNIKRFMVIKGD